MVKCVGRGEAYGYEPFGAAIRESTNAVSARRISSLGRTRSARRQLTARCSFVISLAPADTEANRPRDNASLTRKAIHASNSEKNRRTREHFFGNQRLKGPLGRKYIPVPRSDAGERQLRQSAPHPSQRSARARWLSQRLPRFGPTFPSHSCVSIQRAV